MPKISELPVGTTVDGTEKIPAVQAGLTVELSVEQVRTFITGVVRVITAPGDVTVAVGDGLIILNKTASQTTNVNLPLSATKVGKVKIVDWKGDSDFFPITVTLNGSDKFNAALTTWTISGPGASAVFDPISGMGYAI